MGYPEGNKGVTIMYQRCKLKVTKDKQKVQKG
jgi:hypothetical protein